MKTRTKQKILIDFRTLLIRFHIEILNALYVPLILYDFRVLKLQNKGPPL